MINVQGIEKKLKLAYEKVEPMGEKIFRCEKQVNGKPAAIYYFDCTGELKTSQALVDFQDTLLAKDYFSHPGSLQWNYYLTFVAEDLLKQDAKKKAIEEDIKYTRKFVIESSQVEEFINFSDLDVNNDSDESNNLLGRWINKLDAANLSGVYQEEARAKVIRDYLEDKKAKRDSQTSNAVAVEPEKFPFIKALTLESYREWPPKGTYTFGPVNLITGSNGVGKTSLLEAVEYYFCGKTKRNQEQLVANGSFSVEFKDGKGPQPFKILSSSDYQDRSNQWFRKSTSRGNTLYEGFNQLIFYNADAAYSLASTDDNKKVYDAMSSLALGEEANRVASRMEAFAQDFDKEVSQNKNRKQKTQELLDSELSIVKDLTKQTSEQPAEVKALILSTLQKLKLKDVDLENVSAFARTTKKVRQVLSSLTSIRSELSWISESSIQTIEAELAKYRSSQKHSTKLDDNIAKIEETIEVQETKVAKLVDESETLKMLQKFLKSGYFELLEKLEKAEKVSESNQKKLEIVESLDSKAIAKLDESKTIAAITEEISNALRDIEKQTKALDEQIEGVSAQVSELVRLSESIKGMGKDFIVAEPSTAACPLCDAPYTPAELKRRINLPGPKSGDAKGIPELQSKLAKLKAKKRELQGRRQAVASLQKAFVELSRFGVSFTATKPIAAHIKFLATIQETLESQRASHEELESKLEKLGEKGFDDETWGLLQAELKLVRRPYKNGSNFNIELIERGIAAIQGEVALCQKIIVDQKAATETAKTQFSDAMKKIFGPATNVSQRAKETDTRLATLERVLGQTVALLTSVELSKKTDFVVVCVELKKAEDWLEKLSLLNKVEGDRAVKLEAIQKRVSEHEKEVKAAKKAYDLAVAAQKVLSNILEKDSKAAAVDSFVLSNHTTIVSIFKKIHAPSEFDDIKFEKVSEDSYNIKLYRRKTEAWVGLSEVSTGQRSALALSIFLALNLRVTGGPRLLLIDDPVAHVDDLNTLSFLDYLREIVIKDKRQLVFATASRKMASLFQMKFQGLEGFPLEVHRLKR